MKISFELTMEDWMAFQENYFSQSKYVKRTKILITAMGSTLFIIVALWEFFEVNRNYYMIGIYLIFSLVWLVFLPKSFDKSYLKEAKKMLEEGDNSALLGIHHIELTNEYFLVKEPGTEYKTHWSTIKKVLENEKYIFIYITSASACIIPKFKIENNKEKVAEFIKIKTSNGANAPS